MMVNWYKVSTFLVIVASSVPVACSFRSDDLSGNYGGRYSVWYHRLKRSTNEMEDVSVNNHTSLHGGHPERYQVATINWSRVENSFIVCMWILFAGLAKIGFRSRYMHRIVSRVPESCLLICLGLLVGGIAYAINKDHQIDKLLFNPDTFFLFILPPIVLEAGYFMPKEPFLDNLGSILTYAIVGTIFNAFAIGCSLFGVYKIGWMPGMDGITLLQCLLFGSIISAVDPVAVISVFEEIHVNIVLYICVFGESLLNDGVAVVLYHLFEQYIELPKIIVVDYIAAIGSFFVVILGGFFIGVIFGYFGSFLTKYTVNNRVIEPTLVFVTCYLAYLAAEIFHLSGIIAIVFAGFIMSSYVEHNISQKSHTTVKYGMKMLANMCETIIFMLLGIAAVSDFWQHWNTGFVLWTLIFITLYRAIAVVSLTWMLNKFRLDRINGVDQFVMAYGGLRGAIAFSLVSLTSPEIVPAIKTMICACIVCILFTSFVQGSTIRPIVEFLHVATAQEHKETMFEDINMRLIDHLMTGIEDCIGHRGHHYWTHRLTKFNTDYLMKWFVREPYKTHDQVLLDTFHRINKREAHDMLLDIEQGGSRNELVSVRTLTNLLMPREMGRSTSMSSFSSMMRSNASDACIDIRAIEMQRQSAVIMSDEALGDAHHLLKKNMYHPRARTNLRYRRGEIDVSHSQKRQDQEILIRRRIHHRKKKTQKYRKNSKHMRNILAHPSRARNGSFNSQPAQGKSYHPSLNSAPSVLGDRIASAPLKEEPEPEDEGIVFTAHSNVDEPDSKYEANNIVEMLELKPVALDKELPWRTDSAAGVVCDPKERRGSVHPHFYEESDEEEEPGASLQNGNNNSSLLPAQPTTDQLTSRPSDADLDELTQRNNTSLPLLLHRPDVGEIIDNMAEDIV